VRDAGTGAVLPYVHIEADGIVLTSGLDGVASFEFPLGKTVILKVRHLVYRPWSRAVPITAERVEVSADLERAIL
jgi:hypothetical protein